MAFGKNTVAENRRASSCCMKAAIVVFVGLCLVGIWMLTSSNIGPEDLSYIIPRSEVKDKASTPSLDSSGTDDVRSGDTGHPENTVEQKSDSKEEDESSKRNGDTKVASDDASETDTSTVENSGETLEDMVLENEDRTQKDEKSDGIGSQETVEDFPTENQSEILNETSSQNGSTHVLESKDEEVVQTSLSEDQITDHNWKLCNVTTRADYIPCLDNGAAIKKLRSTKHYEHRERHCPEQAPTCLVPLPEGYKQSIKWPQSRDKVSFFTFLFLHLSLSFSLSDSGKVYWLSLSPCDRYGTIMFRTPSL